MLEEGDFSWQAQYLVMLECHVSWQAQYLAKFWEVAGAGQCCVFLYKMRLDGEIFNLSEQGVCGVSSSWSVHGGIVRRQHAAAFEGFFDQILKLHFLRKSRKICAFSDLGLLLLVWFAW